MQALEPSQVERFVEQGYVRLNQHSLKTWQRKDADAVARSRVVILWTDPLGSPGHRVHLETQPDLPVSIPAHVCAWLDDR